MAVSSAPPLADDLSIPTYLHPVALRSTASASSTAAAAASKAAEAALRHQQAGWSAEEQHPRQSQLVGLPAPPPFPLPPLPSPTEEAYSSASPTAHSACSGGSSPSDSSSPHRSALPPVAGLRARVSHYPNLTLRDPNGEQTVTDIRVLTAAQYVELHKSYLQSAAEADESLVFPWLHCCDQPGTAQAAYFGGSGSYAGKSKRGYPPVPRYRGLTVVTADGEGGGARRASLASISSSVLSDPGRERTRARTGSLGSSSTISSASLESAVSSLFEGSLNLVGSPVGSASPTTMNVEEQDMSMAMGASMGSPPASITSFEGPERRAALLTSALLPSDILARCPHTGGYYPEFATPQLPPNVNLRLFKQQPARYATISDVVVYSEHGLCEDAVVLAQLVREAQDRCYRARGGREAGAVKYRTWIVGERFEGFEEKHGEWVAVDGWGWRRNRVNFIEREREEMCHLTRCSEIASNVWLGNSEDAPGQCTGDMSRSASHDQRNCVATSDSSSSLATTLTQPDDGNVHSFAMCIEAHDQARMPTHSQLASHVAHLDRVEASLDLPCSAASVARVVSEGAKETEILKPGLAELSHLEVVSTSQTCTSSAQYEDLIYRLVELCQWVRGVAMGGAGSRKGRKLGKRVLIYCHDGYTESSLFALAYTMFDRGCSLPDAYLYLQLVRNRSFFVYPADVQLLLRVDTRLRGMRKRAEALQSATAASAMPAASAPASSKRSFRVPFGLSGRHSLSDAVAKPSPLTPEERHPWFYDDRFDGHFPSRILPHVYLGNWNHASNALMLKALGITHVVSMGETALIPPRSPAFLLPGRKSGGHGVDAGSSLWVEHKAGRMAVLDMKGVADDGVDSIKPYMDQALDFMEEARLSGGKVLVHCRVGVSRSASIVIAYVMEHLNMDLVSAYLMVRSRRLNILIQPNLRFMWALKRWEAELVDRLEPGSKERRERESKQVSWAYLAKEIAELNAKYSVI